jgi:hypothetical protein
MYKYFLMSDDGLELGLFETVADTLKFIYEAYEDDNVKALILQGDNISVITDHYNLNMIIKEGSLTTR